MDNPPPPYEAVSPSQAAGPRIRLQPGGIIQERANLNDEAKESMRDLLELVKNRILPDSVVTDQELRKFLDLVYDQGWQPGQFCEAAYDEMTRRSAYDCAFTIGTLRESLPQSVKRAGRSRPRSFSERALYRDTAPRATQWWRQAGAPVRLLVEHKQDGVISFSLRDHKLAIIHADARVNYDFSIADAYFHAMRRNDSFMTSKVHRYNMLQAVYICRNRLTHWSNPGVDIEDLPRAEKLDMAFSDVKLCRSIDDVQGCPQAAKDMIRATPPPKLFP